MMACTLKFVHYCTIFIHGSIADVLRLQGFLKVTDTFTSCCFRPYIYRAYRSGTLKEGEIIIAIARRLL